MEPNTPNPKSQGVTRNKIALTPGHSLMDWIRFCSGKDLSGTSGKLLDVNAEQLRSHNSRSDAWLAIRGIVYNVTEYMPFHPGGEDELLKGVGKDATNLFDEIHPWVNYESLLKACIVGPLTGCSHWLNSSASNQKSESSGKLLSLPSTSVSTLKKPVTENERRSDVSLKWKQQLSSLNLIFPKKSSLVKVSLYLENSKKLIASIDDNNVECILDGEVKWPCEITVDENVVINLVKQLPKLWLKYGSSNVVQKNLPEYTSLKLIRVISLTHDTKLIYAEYVDPVFHLIHVGHHVYLKLLINGVEVIRPYTPVALLLENSEVKNRLPFIAFIVKNYPEGLFSKKISSLVSEDEIQMSHPVGDFDVKWLADKVYLLLLAAGTGITPMTSLIDWANKSSRLKVTLLYFNKSEQDIILKKELDSLENDHKTNFTVRHILSASSTWNGYKGYVSRQLIEDNLEDASSAFICFCGPQQFSKSCHEYLIQLNVDSDHFHCFSG